jgi:hypothetical protein
VSIRDYLRDNPCHLDSFFQNLVSLKRLLVTMTVICSFFVLLVLKAIKGTPRPQLRAISERVISSSVGMVQSFLPMMFI